MTVQVPIQAAKRRANRGRGMSVYVDDAIWTWRGLKWAHLLADDTDELHRFAGRLGIHRTSYQGPPRTWVPHYDLTSYERRRAIALGAIPCSREEIVAVLRRVRLSPRKAGTHVPEPAVIGPRLRGDDTKRGVVRWSEATPR